jgi:hypothetical protein
VEAGSSRCKSRPQHDEQLPHRVSVGTRIDARIDRDGVLRMLRHGPVTGDDLAEGVAAADAAAS